MVEFSLMILIGSFFALGGLFGAIFSYRYFKRVYFTHWYDISSKGPKGDLTFEDVKKLMEDDPKDFKSRKRVKFPLVFSDLLILLAGFGIYGSLAFLFLQTRTALTLEDLEHLGFFIGGFGVFVTGFGIYRQGRVKTRAENRQAWINSLRTDMNKLIAGVPKFRAKPDTIQECREKGYDKFHTRLELHLNPHEMPHRAFMALIRVFYHIRIEIDEDFIEKLNLKRFGNWKKTTGKEKKQVGDYRWVWKSDKDWDDALSCAFRLANVMLKREWEQVKYIK